MCVCAVKAQPAGAQPVEHPKADEAALAPRPRPPPPLCAAACGGLPYPLSIIAGPIRLSLPWRGDPMAQQARQRSLGVSEGRRAPCLSTPRATRLPKGSRMTFGGASELAGAGAGVTPKAGFAASARRCFSDLVADDREAAPLAGEGADAWGGACGAPPASAPLGLARLRLGGPHEEPRRPDSVPVFVMLPLDTVRRRAAGAGRAWRARSPRSGAHTRCLRRGPSAGLLSPCAPTSSLPPPPP